jgi:glycosyltransferase involved in cell wall biosynthesis
MGTHARLLLTSPLVYLQMARKTASLAWHWPVRAHKAFAYFLEAGLLLDWMLFEGLNHVHVHFSGPAAAAALIASAGRTITYSLSIHGPVEFFNIDKEFLQEKSAHALFVRCISFFCQSQVMTVLPPEQWSKLHIVHCGIDPAVYKVRPDPRNDSPMILSVGRLVPLKGQHLLLQACSILRSRGLRFTLTFVGDGPDRKSLEAYCCQHRLDDIVTFAGSIGQDKIHAFYDRTDIFALPSFAEGVPVVLMEAMAKGIACVSTYVGGIRELIESGRNGVLLAPADLEALMDCLEELLYDSDLRVRLGTEGRKTVEAEFDTARNGSLMAEQFKSYLAGKE